MQRRQQGVQGPFPRGGHSKPKGPTQMIKENDPTQRSIVNGAKHVVPIDRNVQANSHR